jgi:hypothetical protein
MRSKPNQAGIRVRHARSCPVRDGGRCRCKPSYEAFTYSARDGKKIRKTFATISAAKAWRAEASTQVRKGELRTSSGRDVGGPWTIEVSGGAGPPHVIEGFFSEQYPQLPRDLLPRIISLALQLADRFDAETERRQLRLQRATK